MYPLCFDANEWLLVTPLYIPERESYIDDRLAAWYRIVACHKIFQALLDLADWLDWARCFIRDMSPKIHA